MLGVPSAASTRCTVDRLTPTRFANSAALHPSSALAARIWGPQIMSMCSVCRATLGASPLLACPRQYDGPTIGIRAKNLSFHYRRVRSPVAAGPRTKAGAVRFGARRAPRRQGERRLRVQQADFRLDARQRVRCAVSGHFAGARRNQEVRPSRAIRGQVRGRSCGPGSRHSRLPPRIRRLMSTRRAAPSLL